MAYTVERLKELFRTETGDELQPYLWEDSEFYEFLNEAQKEFARETDYFKDMTTPELTELTVTADDPWVPLDPRVVEVRRAHLDGYTSLLQIVNTVDLDTQYLASAYGSVFAGNWLVSTGTPKLLIGDLETDKLRLVPIPTQNGTLRLSIIRLPLNDITGKDSVLEISEDSYRRSLLMFCKSMAYNKQDSEAYAPEKALEYKRDFYAYCEVVKSRQKRKQRRLGTVQYGGL